MKRLLLSGLMTLGVAASVLGQDVSVNSTEARIGPRDVIEIKVVQDDKFNTRTTVSDEGAVTLHAVGKITVGGLTQRQAEQRIKQVLEARVLKSADVTVQIAEYGSKPISVLGAVTRPGSVGGTNLTLLQAITQAGGLAPGYGKTLYVLRTGQNGLSEQIAIDLDDLLVNGNPDLNLPLSASDVVNIPTETPVTVYVMGEVTHPGKVELRRSQNPSLLQAIAAAGGPTDRASKSVKITRTAGGQSQTLTANWKRIAAGSGKDVPLQDGDTIFIDESIF